MNNIITQEEKYKIEAFCKHYKITNYKINGDGSIDVDGNVCFTQIITSIPLKFNKVSGDFICNGNNLTSLEGCPTKVSGDFNCSGSEYLRSLIGCPSIVGGSFLCAMCDLTSLDGCPSNVGGNFNCNGNGLISLEGSPLTIGGNFYCAGNHLRSLTGCTKVIPGIFDACVNKLSTLEGSPAEVCGNIQIIRKNYFPAKIEELFSYNRVLNNEEQLIFFKYHTYYDVWTPEFNEDAMHSLVADIKDWLM